MSYNHILMAEKFCCNLIVMSNKAVKEFLKKRIEVFVNVVVNLFCYESFKSGSVLLTSIADLQFISKSMLYHLRSQMPTVLKEAFHRNGLFMSFIPGRVTKVFVCDASVETMETSSTALPTELANPATGAEVVGHRKTCSGVHIIIIIHFPSSGGDLAIHSTELLHNYANCDTRVLEMGTFVKHWATARRIQRPLNSDPLFHTSIGLRELQWIEGCEVFYWRDVSAIKKAAHQGKLTRNKQPVVELLRGFFDYYSAGKFITGRRRFCYKTDVVSVRISGGLTTKNEKGGDVSEGGEHVNPARGRQRYYLAIEDPFRTKLNVAGGDNMRGLSVIKDEFARARNIILITDNGGIGDDLFRPKVSPQNKPNLQRELHDLGLANTQ
ncbi:hypothetical protein PABG_03583 [Paracoccidioides brasiliensis Pb03]|nr:hypothetical protein PABG_03583 [Paracoccidioides brasiliensis Pb03]